MATSETVVLDTLELNAVIAGLRLLQAFRRGEVTLDSEQAGWIEAIERDSGEALGDPGLEFLIQFLNT